MRSTPLATAASVALLGLSAPGALAQSPPCTLDVKDAAFDQTTTLGPSAAPPTVVTPSNALDIRNVRVQHDPSKGQAATTATLTLGHLTRKVPAGSTAIVWTVQWTAANGTIYFVRAVNDLTDTLVFEWGEQVPATNVVVTSVLPRYEYRGATTGRLVPGENGIVEIVIPAALSPAGVVLGDLWAQTSEGRQAVPNAVATPSRGLSSPSDRAPDGTGVAKYTVSACPPA